MSNQLCIGGMWKALPDWPTIEVSDKGQIRNISKSGVNILSQHIGQRGYFIVQPRIKGRRPKLKVHRAIAMCFCKKESGQEHVRHLDGNSLNNSIGNLSWGTHQDNMLDRNRHGTDNRGERCGASKLTWRIVKAIRELWKRNCPVTDTRIGEYFGVSQPTISDIRRNKTWQICFA